MMDSGSNGLLNVTNLANKRLLKHQRGNYKKQLLLCRYRNLIASRLLHHSV